MLLYLVIVAVEQWYQGFLDDSRRCSRSDYVNTEQKTRLTVLYVSQDVDKVYRSTNPCLFLLGHVFRLHCRKQFLNEGRAKCIPVLLRYHNREIADIVSVFSITRWIQLGNVGINEVYPVDWSKMFFPVAFCLLDRRATACKGLVNPRFYSVVV